MQAFDWNAAFTSAGQIGSAADATRLLNAVCAAFEIAHFRISDPHLVVSATVGAEGPSPLRAEAASAFDRLTHEDHGNVAQRVLRGNVPFWAEDTGNVFSSSSKKESILCCPVRYGRSARTSGLFVVNKNSPDMSDLVCLQALVVSLLERFLELGVSSDPSNHTLSERERACLELFSNGMDFTAIAEQLGLAETVVASSMNSIGIRLRARNLYHAVTIAIRDELI